MIGYPIYCQNFMTMILNYTDNVLVQFIFLFFSDDATSILN